MNQLGRKTASGGVVTSAGSVISLALQFAIVLPILARLIPPSQFGLVGMASAFILFFSRFNDFGISAALVRAENPSRAFWSTAFWTNLGLGAIMTCFALWAAPFVAAFYREPLVEDIVQALAAILMLHCLLLVPIAWMQRNFKFSQLAAIDLLAAIASAAVAVGLALNGAGVWALVGQQLTMFATKSICTLGVQRAPIGFVFQWSSIVEVLPFSLGITAVGLVNSLNNQIDNILIGRALGAEQLGFYGRANIVRLRMATLISGGSAYALYPAMSLVKDQPDRFCAMCLRATRLLMAVGFPALLGISAVSVPLTSAMLGSQWGPTAPLLQWMCYAGLIQMLPAFLRLGWKAKGRSDVLLRWSIIGTIVNMMAFVIGIAFQSLLVLVVAYTITNAIIALPFVIISLKSMGISRRAFLNAVWPQAMAAGIMVLGLYALELVFPSIGTLPSFVQLVLLAGMGAALYGLTLWLFYRTVVNELIAEVRALFL
ncbi:MAG: lipopolysaccharide biosynthesis protein [Pseudomonadota bacterium]